MLKLVDTKIHNEPKFIDLGSGAPEMTIMTDHFKQTYFILAEGPRPFRRGLHESNGYCPQLRPTDYCRITFLRTRVFTRE